MRRTRILQAKGNKHLNIKMLPKPTHNPGFSSFQQAEILLGSKAQTIAVTCSLLQSLCSCTFILERKFLALKADLCSYFLSISFQEPFVLLRATVNSYLTLQRPTSSCHKTKENTIGNCI